MAYLIAETAMTMSVHNVITLLQVFQVRYFVFVKRRAVRLSLLLHIKYIATSL